MDENIWEDQYRTFAVIAKIEYTGRLEVFARNAEEARQLADNAYPSEWDSVYPEIVTIESVEELDD